MTPHDPLTCDYCHAMGYAAEYEDMRDQRDHWIRLFNRLDAAVNHHKRDAEANASSVGVEGWDSALYAAQDRILRDAVGAK